MSDQLGIEPSCPDCRKTRVLSHEGLRSITKGTNSGRCRKCASRSRIRPTLRERFYRRVQITPDCWQWTAGTNSNGYGQLRRGGDRNSPLVLAHRASWEIHVGAVPDGLHVLHHCDNPRCVRPSHLFLGTHRDNMDDMAAKGRGAWQKT